MQQNTKLAAALEIAKIRGHKELSEHQLRKLNALVLIPDMSAIDCLNEALNAPQERIDRTVHSIRKHSSNIFTRLADVLRPEDTNK